MGGYCRCLAPFASAASNKLRLQSEEVDQVADAVEALQRRDAACREDLAATGRRLKEAVEFRAVCEAAAKEASDDADKIVMELAAAQVKREEAAEAKMRREARRAAVGALRSKLLNLQAEHRALRSRLASPPWKAGYDMLIDGLRTESKSLADRLADRRRLNRCLEEDHRAQREAAAALLELGDQQVCALASVRDHNDRLETEMERVAVEVGSLQDRYWDAVPFQGMDATELARLRQSLHVSGLVSAKLEKDLECERRLAGVAEMEAEEFEDYLRECRMESEAAAESKAEAATSSRAAREAPKLPLLNLSSAPLLTPALSEASDPTPPERWHRDRPASDAAEAGPQKWSEEFAEMVAAVSRANSRATEKSAKEARSAAASEAAAAEASARAAAREEEEQARAALAEAGAKALMEAQNRNLDLRQEILAAREQLQQRQLREEIASLRGRAQPSEAGGLAPVGAVARGPQPPLQEPVVPMAREPQLLLQEPVAPVVVEQPLPLREPVGVAAEAGQPLLQEPLGATMREQQLLLREQREQEALRRELAQRLALSSKALDGEELLQRERLLQDRLREEISARTTTSSTVASEKDLLERERLEQERLREVISQSRDRSQREEQELLEREKLEQERLREAIARSGKARQVDQEELLDRERQEQERLREAIARSGRAPREGKEELLEREHFEQERLRDAIAKATKGASREEAVATPASRGNGAVQSEPLASRPDCADSGPSLAVGSASAGEALRQERLEQQRLMEEIAARTAAAPARPSSAQGDGQEAQLLLHERLEQQRLRYEIAYRSGGSEARPQQAPAEPTASPAAAGGACRGELPTASPLRLMRLPEVPPLPPQDTSRPPPSAAASPRERGGAPGGLVVASASRAGFALKEFAAGAFGMGRDPGASGPLLA